MRYAAFAALLLILALVVAVPSLQPAVAAEPPPEELAEKVRVAIERGIKYFRGREKNGHWERSGELNLNNVALNGAYPGGTSALAALALLYSGVPADDDMMQRALNYFRTLKIDRGSRTYVVSLQTMVFALANQPEDKERIQQGVDWLIEARSARKVTVKGVEKTELRGWTYGRAGGEIADNSNTQYALLGLHEGFQAGADVSAEVWEEIRDFYLRTAHPGRTKAGDPGLGWSYRNEGSGSTFTMTTAGLCGLLIADSNLRASRLDKAPKCDGPDCGLVPTEDKINELTTDQAIDLALKTVGSMQPGRAGDVPTLQNTFYALYGIERAGRFSGQRFLGEKDWYRIGCEYLTAPGRQADDGSILGRYEASVPELGTAFALLFLAKGRTPVLISKLVHDPEDDWNRNRGDARNLTNYCSKELFKNVPLAWQVFDARRAGDLNPDSLAAQLLQSPVAYVSGKKAPRFKDGEEQLLRTFLDNGGFLMAEACCGSKEFHDGFVSLINERIFNRPGDPKLQKLPPGHPVYYASGKFNSDPNKFPLYGIEMGCKTVVVYSPVGLSCWWDANYAKEGKGRDVFELGTNIVAYATGLEPPRPRLTQVDVVKDDRERSTPRGYLKVAQVRHSGDPKPAPQAMPNLMTEMRRLGLDVAIQTEDLGLNAEALVDFRFLYMHGRGQFSLAEPELKNLRFHLESGGLLFADACCGAKPFDAAFRKMIKDLWPDKQLEPIPVKDELFGKELNGDAITEVRCRREGADGRVAGPDFRTVAPQLEGIKVNGRWVVIYSRYDIGCALEKHQSTDCLGHDHASAVKLGRAAVLYAMRR